MSEKAGLRNGKITGNCQRISKIAVFVELELSFNCDEPGRQQSKVAVGEVIYQILASS